MDISTLRQIAEAAAGYETAWWTKSKLRTSFEGLAEPDVELIAACDPQTVLRLLDVVQAAQAIPALMAQLREICRQWEPDHSSGKDRHHLVLARDAESALRAAIDSLAASAGRG